MSQVAITNPEVVINNIAIAIVPNSLSYNEGLGEQVMKTQASGSAVEAVFSDNAETKLSMVKFTLFPTADNVARVREWKANRNANAITLSDPLTGFTRSLNGCALTNNYDVTLGSEQTFEVEFYGDPAV